MDTEQAATPPPPTGKSAVDWLEVTATVLLGIASVLIAWSTYQSQLWGGVQDTRNTASTLTIVDASDNLGGADSTRSLDQTLFADWILLPEGDASDLLLSQMTEEGQAASIQWLSSQDVRPFDGDGYILKVYGEGLAKFEAASVLFEGASEANGNSDNYVLTATIVALVLFLSGVSLVLNGRRTRLILVVASGMIIAIVAVRLVALPLAGSAQSADEITTEATEAALADFDVLIEAAQPAPQTAADTPEPEPEPEPEPFALSQGGTAFAVYVEVIPTTESSGNLDDDFADVTAAFGEQGVSLTLGTLDCDEGATEGLGLEAGEYNAAATYFGSAADGELFVEQFDLDVPVIEVTTFCLD